MIHRSSLWDETVEREAISNILCRLLLATDLLVQIETVEMRKIFKDNKGELEGDELL